MSETFRSAPRPEAKGAPIIAAIVAVTKSGAIGSGNDLLFRIPEDQRFFRETTQGSPIIMGRRTFESIGRILPGRRNIMMTRRPYPQVPGLDVVSNLDEALQLARTETLPRGEIFILGGGEIFELAMPLTDRIYLTEIDARVDGDTYFPAWPKMPEDFVEKQREERPENDPPFRFLVFDRKTLQV